MWRSASHQRQGHLSCVSGVVKLRIECPHAPHHKQWYVCTASHNTHTQDGARNTPHTHSGWSKEHTTHTLRMEQGTHHTHTQDEARNTPHTHSGWSKDHTTHTLRMEQGTHHTHTQDGVRNTPHTHSGWSKEHTTHTLRMKQGTHHTRRACSTHLLTGH